MTYFVLYKAEGETLIKKIEESSCIDSINKFENTAWDCERMLAVVREDVTVGELSSLMFTKEAGK